MWSRKCMLTPLPGLSWQSIPGRSASERMVENRRQAQRIQETMEGHMREVGTHPTVTWTKC